MISVNLQLFAKTLAQMQQYRKSKAASQFAQEPVIQDQLKEEKKPIEVKKPTKGEAVSSVNRNETYEIYLVRNGTEVPLGTNGNTILRTGAQILAKFYYDKERGLWISNAKGWRYRIRRRV